ncbi:MAG: VPLPA-CTERM sorting domain-containing protein [Pseudomonadota bacterium]
MNCIRVAAAAVVAGTMASPAMAIVYTVDLSGPNTSLTGTIELDTTGTLSATEFRTALVDYDITLSIGGATDSFLPSNSSFGSFTYTVDESEIRVSRSREGSLLDGGTNFSEVYFFPGRSEFFVGIGAASSVGSISFANGAVLAVNEVPLPAGGWLLISGLGALYVARRREA